MEGDIQGISLEEFVEFTINSTIRDLEKIDSEDDLQIYFPMIDVRGPDLWIAIENSLRNDFNNILEIANKIKSSVITFWTIEEAKSIYGSKVFISKGNKIPVFFEDKEKDVDYLHECSEEFMLGILSVSKIEDIFDIFPEQLINFHAEKGTDFDSMTIEDISPNYVRQKYSRFYAVISIGSIYFDTIDVIQGVITGAKWLNKDPHNYIRDIYENGQRVNFL